MQYTTRQYRVDVLQNGSAHSCMLRLQAGKLQFSEYEACNNAHLGASQNNAAAVQMPILTSVHP